jgi:hypothetical protein
MGDPEAIEWPERWQHEAIDALMPYLGTDDRLRILVGPPRRARSGTLVEGHVYLEDRTPMIVHDRSGRPDVYPGPLLMGPVLRIELLRPRRPPVVLFANPDWDPDRHRFRVALPFWIALVAVLLVMFVLGGRHLV